MEVPAESPDIVVNACWGGAQEEHARTAGWHTALFMEEDGYTARVYVRG